MKTLYAIDVVVGLGLIAHTIAPASYDQTVTRKIQLLL
jgi:hypothetical protein